MKKMRDRKIFFLVALFFLLFPPQMHAGGEKITVAVTIMPQAYFVERLGGIYTDVQVMIPQGANPETYEPTPQNLMNLSRALIYAGIGLGSFPAEKKFLNLFGNGKNRMEVVTMSQGAPRTRDPHIWLSPKVAESFSRHVFQALARIDGAHQSYYSANLAALLEDIAKADRAIRAMLDGQRGKSFMVFHPAWGNFAAAYGLEQLALEEEGKSVSLARLKKMVDLAKEKKIDVVFVQRGFDTRNARAVAREIGGTIVETDPLAWDWPNNLLAFAGHLRKALR